MYKYNLRLKNYLLTLNDYLLSCGCGGGGSGSNSGNGSSCSGCDYCFIVVNILFYHSGYIILL